jgi:hypothetical protein
MKVNADALAGKNWGASLPYNPNEKNTFND